MLKLEQTESHNPISVSSLISTVQIRATRVYIKYLKT